MRRRRAVVTVLVVHPRVGLRRLRHCPLRPVPTAAPTAAIAAATVPATTIAATLTPAAAFGAATFLSSRLPLLG